MTSALPVIMLTAKGMTVDKVVGLTAGADDYLVKPFDTLELIARVRSTLRRNQEFREVSPLTGLPGNTRILREIADRVRSGADYAVCYIDIDRFKSVNDAYGFARGDEFITALARSLHRAVVDGRPAAGVPRPRRRRRLRGRLHARPGAAADRRRRSTDFERAADELYDPEDARRGYVEVPDRRGGMQRAAPGDAVDRGGPVDRRPAAVHRSARGHRGRVRDEDGREEPARLVRRDRPPHAADDRDARRRVT